MITNQALLKMKSHYALPLGDCHFGRRLVGYRQTPSNPPEHSPKKALLSQVSFDPRNDLH
jgi:hypothetical protein